MQSKAKYLLFTVLVVLVGSVFHLRLHSQTRLNLSTQTQDATKLFRPGHGTMLVCMGNQCTSALTGEAVVYRTTAPILPGPCTTQGTSAIAVDTSGYFYICTVTGWRRTPTPMLSAW